MIKLFGDKKQTDAEINPQPETQQVEEDSSLPSQEQSETNNEPTHFDQLLQGPQVPIESGGSGSSAGMLSEEDFHKVFCLAFNVSSSITRLKSLSVKENDSAALGCSKAVYETALEIPALHFLLQPGGKWGGRILAIGAFVVPMSLAVKDELQERRGAGVVSSAGGASILAPEETLSQFGR